MNFLQMSQTNKILIGWKCHIRPEDKRGAVIFYIFYETDIFL